MHAQIDAVVANVLLAAKYQDELVSAGTLKQIIKIIQADSETFVEGVVVKALAVIQRFTGTRHTFTRAREY